MSPRLHLPTAAPGAHELTGGPFHYLTRVLRLRPGDALTVFDGRGQAFAARLVSAEVDRARLELQPGVPDATVRPVALVQGLPKADKLELVLQKGTELGATDFCPVESARSVVRLVDRSMGSKLERWQRIASEAARQCGRNDVPTVHSPQTLLACATVLAPDWRMIILDEEERSLPLRSALLGLAPEQPLALFIGPEGGFARDEVAALQALGAQSVTLGRQVLRTETASLAALAIIRFVDGELG